nr:serine/threonine-protein kinase [Polyangia bacterium]
MKVCPNCQTKYPDDANFCPQETCATPEGPRRLEMVAEAAPGARYALEQPLGGGRSGEVYRARDSQTGATVVYKRVARAVLTSPAIVERSQRELKQLQRAQSPRIARVLDFGKEPDGNLFVISELCEGQPLDRLVASSGPFRLDRAKKIVAQIGEALLEGQKVGVVHHDLAAKNVLVSAGDDVKVINFVAPVPVTETVFGVPEYLSPEQAEGKLVDQRSNTYSLGGILMLMLTGRPPIEADSPGAALDQVLKGTIAPPSGRVPGLNPEIDRVILKAMDRSPNRRPLTLRQFLTEVAGLVMAPGAPADSGRAAFAKTMMFTGGSPEVQNLVNQAMAARAEANGNGTPERDGNTLPLATVAAEQRDPNATPPPTGRPAEPPRRTHGAAVAATMVAMPAASGPRFGAGQAPPPAGMDNVAQPTPPPAGPLPGAATPPPAAGPAPAGAAAAGAPKPSGATGGAAAFRETLWFKQGDVDQMVADARAKLEASKAKGTPAPEPEPLPIESDAKPLEERYVDDGSISAEDRKKYSLRQGATSAALPTVGGKIPGERMSAEEMMGEIGGGKKVGIIIAAVVVVAAIVAVVVVGFRGKKVAQNAAALTPVTVPEQPAAPTPPPAAPAAPPAAAAPAPSPAAVRVPLRQLVAPEHQCIVEQRSASRIGRGFEPRDEAGHL